MMAWMLVGLMITNKSKMAEVNVLYGPMKKMRLKNGKPNFQARCLTRLSQTMKIIVIKPIISLLTSYQVAVSSASNS